jgi:hypothetical protein
MKNEGPLTRPFVVLSGGNDEFAVLDGDAQLLAGLKSDAFGSALRRRRLRIAATIASTVGS